MKKNIGIIAVVLAGAAIVMTLSAAFIVDRENRLWCSSLGTLRE